MVQAVASPFASDPEAPLLQVENLKTHFISPDGTTPAVDGVSFQLHRGRTLAVVGESGSGKTVTGYSILRLVPQPGRIVGGRIVLRSQRLGEIDLAALRDDSEELYRVRGGVVSMIFQEPMTALSPVHTIGAQIAEAILLHQDVDRHEARRRTVDMLARVGIARPDQRFDQYPHEFSGGMRQRVVIAMAMVCKPELLIADEPTTALDVTIQAQILGLIKEQQREIGCGVLMITHDFGVVAQVADDVAVMQSGRIVEIGSVREVLRNPRHEYTRALLDALPSRRPRYPSLAARDAEGGVPPALLSVRGLTKRFDIVSRGLRRRVIDSVRAVEDVSFEIMPGETLGLVGESGSGKTTAARCILRALQPTAGGVGLRLPNGSVAELAGLADRKLKPLRPHVQMIFQDPFSSLNPRMTVRDIIAEPLLVHGVGTRAERDDRVVDMLRRVGLDPANRERYPHAFSGGQRQRIGIARALILRPSLVVCDEATSALDVSVQAQVLDLLKELQKEFGVTYLFVAHNLDVVRNFCDRVAVMRRGRIVELAETERIFTDPRHPYTKLLLSVIPSPDPDIPINFEVGEQLAKLDAVN